MGESFFSFNYTILDFYDYDNQLQDYTKLIYVMNHDNVQWKEIEIFFWYILQRVNRILVKNCFFYGLKLILPRLQKG